MSAKEVFAKFASSRKAWVLLAATIGAVAMNLAGRVEGEKALEFIKWTVSTWLASQAAEDIAGKLKG